MRPALVVVVVVVAALLVTVSSGSTQPLRSAAPQLRVTGPTPVRVLGSSFRPGEPVQVMLVAGASRRALGVRADRAGRFSAVFRDTPVDPCNGVSASARGRFGSRAAAKLPQRQCPPQP